MNDTQAKPSFSHSVSAIPTPPSIRSKWLIAFGIIGIFISSLIFIFYFEAKKKLEYQYSPLEKICILISVEFHVTHGIASIMGGRDLVHYRRCVIACLVLGIVGPSFLGVVAYFRLTKLLSLNTYHWIDIVLASLALYQTLNSIKIMITSSYILCYGCKCCYHWRCSQWCRRSCNRWSCCYCCRCCCQGESLENTDDSALPYETLALDYQTNEVRFSHSASDVTASTSQ